MSSSSNSDKQTKPGMEMVAQQNPQPTSSNNTRDQQVFNEEEQIGAEGRNVNRVVCNQCKSVIFRQNTAQFQQGPQLDLPLPYQKQAFASQSDDQLQSEEHNQWWVVTDMFAFENVGFTHSFRGRKFLACADCEIGPIGWVCAESGKYLIAVQRVQHAT